MSNIKSRTSAVTTKSVASSHKRMQSRVDNPPFVSQKPSMGSLQTLKRNLEQVQGKLQTSKSYRGPLDNKYFALQLLYVRTITALMKDHLRFLRAFRKQTERYYPTLQPADRASLTIIKETLPSGIHAREREIEDCQSLDQLISRYLQGDQKATGQDLGEVTMKIDYALLGLELAVRNLEANMNKLRAMRSNSLSIVSSDEGRNVLGGEGSGSAIVESRPSWRRVQGVSSARNQ
ncbi:uncharacterized protein STEHIDRAFT_127171 [Stereum hirsutum FP-91666 SS1]|uniref:uncharacterized protein n=1 Tax=Stereum hirsutum (strain FP-91666) TaxID=721885 RepID=UPI000440CFAB|nr:uncharacterized protein STEHIDRAFT_127171 [Stereum hirsutum FP-91666 SS1]EIM92340.1 hypothetical protein STEHIDRAFT_127171 [Stereum hirsutum FP-91666 SS1]